ncbi:kinesin-like protein KIF16B [Lingula anatina]|uniref:Kinesin-like protein n=1 Tax=Lingula anatina TaxID=7574 RepID=A0A1S3HN92_LINAN|nr:kinesin-like protein KIF16B [Lingula anatina]|eukprot:XP_013386504.1 kinesin-like protein KIF16B [Lingula anatina]
MSNVKVAVRVRPMTKKEIDAKAKFIIGMKRDTVSIYNVKLGDADKTEYGDSRDKVKHFVFDYAYWSVDSKLPDYASQELLFQDLGTEVLQSAYEGYNACVFAYGQTGTGKTFTMMGDPEQVGLTPRICEGLFARMDDTDEGEHISYRIDVSYLEIYNERVRDLLAHPLSKHHEKYTLKVREHPKDGPYVQDLSRHLVKENQSIQALIEKGNENRTTAATYMHAGSSRSHAIFTINFTQAKLDADLPSEKVSKIHLVDLAGSERADPSASSKEDGTTRLKEGANINKSLVTLGNVIKALAEKSVRSWGTESLGSSLSFDSEHSKDALNSSGSPNRRNVKPFIPYRDSVLTWLLKESLGGNSKTIMIATITPADTYYNETLSTLRYAQRAKSIINKPTVNEDNNVRLIRELRNEIERLKQLLCHAHMAGSMMLNEIDSGGTIAEKLLENEEKAQKLTQNWIDKWNEAHSIMAESNICISRPVRRTKSMGVIVDSQLPHLIGMDDDILSTGIIMYHLKEGKTSIGREDSTRDQDIVLSGPDILSEHCIIKNRGGAVYMYPFDGAMCQVNGQQIYEPIKLTQGDVVLLGRTNMFRFNNPIEAAKLREHRKSGGGSLPLNGSLSRASSVSSIFTYRSDIDGESPSPTSMSPMMLNSSWLFVCIVEKWVTLQAPAILRYSPFQWQASLGNLSFWDSRSELL